MNQKEKKKRKKKKTREKDKKEKENLQSSPFCCSYQKQMCKQQMTTTTPLLKAAFPNSWRVLGLTDNKSFATLTALCLMQEMGANKKST